MIKSGFILLLFLAGCIYDPPKKGKDLIFHNQRDQALLIIESSAAERSLSLYDTAQINDRIFISRRPEYMEGFTQWAYFFSDEEYLRLKKAEKSITIPDYFKEQLHLQVMQMVKDKLFKEFIVNIEELNDHDINHVFILPDTILFEHRYDYYRFKVK